MNRNVLTSFTVLCLLSTVFLMGLSFNVQPVRADWTWTETIYIRADGSVDPDTAPISTVNNVTYTLTDNIFGDVPEQSGAIVVERDNIILDGASWTLQGAESGIGISMTKRSNVTVRGMRIKAFRAGIMLWVSSNNSISGNHITANNGSGIWVDHCSNNRISGNDITANNNGIMLGYSSNNIIYHNNFVDNSEQMLISPGSTNVWDDGYTSGGNYWSDYTSRYPNATELDDSGIWNMPYVIEGSNQDNYPLVSPWTEHELVASIAAPASLPLNSSSSLNATVTNEELNDEVDVELELLINGTTADSTIISLLQAGDSYTLSYLWTPTVEGTYNVTAYAHPVPGETSIENNQMSKLVTVSALAPPEARVGVEAGDWIKCDYAVSGWPSGTPYPEWLKVEIQSVEGTTATVEVTMHMSDGTEQSDTVSVDIVAGGGTFDTLFGFLIPADCSTGDSITMGGDGLTFTVTIDGETTRTYAGASRTVVYASFSQYGTELTYYWDKEKGIMVEASTTSAGVTATAKATEANMWEATPFWMQWWFYAIVAVVIVVLAGAVYALRKRKAPTAPMPSPENADQSSNT